MGFQECGSASFRRPAYKSLIVRCHLLQDQKFIFNSQNSHVRLKNFLFGTKNLMCYTMLVNVSRRVERVLGLDCGSSKYDGPLNSRGGIRGGGRRRRDGVNVSCTNRTMVHGPSLDLQGQQTHRQHRHQTRHSLLFTLVRQ
jgi:hypothetical protein